MVTEEEWRVREVRHAPRYFLAGGRVGEEALAHAQALALRVLAERLEHGETPPEPFDVSFLAA